MAEPRSLMQCLLDAGTFEGLPKNLKPAIKAVDEDWTTHGGFSWWQPGRRWINSPDDHFDPETCTNGGLHVAFTLQAARSGGAPASHLLAVGYEPVDREPNAGKLKVGRVYVLRPFSFRKINLERADLGRANLRGANLEGANLREAYLRGADLGNWERGPNGYARKVQESG